MAIRSVATMEIPEKKLVLVKKQSPYPEDFLEQKIDLLLGIIARNVPLIGTKLCQFLLERDNKEILKQYIIDHFTSAHQYAFTELKNVVKARMDKDNYDFSFEKMKSLIVELETEYCSPLSELGIEDTATIDAFAKNQAVWYHNSFSWGK